MPSESNVSDEITSQWKGGKVTARDSNNAIIDVYPGYINVGNGTNCALHDPTNVRKVLLNKCPAPGFTKSNPNDVVFLTIQLVPGNPGLCLADPAQGPAGAVIMEPCVPNDRNQSWRYQYNELRAGHGVGECLTANGLGNELKLTKCEGYASHKWALP